MLSFVTIQHPAHTKGIYLSKSLEAEKPDMLQAF